MQQDVKCVGKQKCAFSRVFYGVLGNLGPNLASSWRRLGVILGHPGPSWRHLGVILGSSWGQFGSSWGFLALILGQFGVFGAQLT